MTAITGNTYPVKDQIKAMGGRWDADRKVWMVDDKMAAEAQWLVNHEAVRAKKPHYATCRHCGCASNGNYYCTDCRIANYGG